jgi:hypothetical protein
MKSSKIAQKKVLAEMLGNDGVGMGTAMLKAGYGKGYAKNPKKLTSTKSWQELMNEFLPDSLIAEKHKALLDKKEIIVVRNGKESETIVTDQIDTNAVKAGVDMAYKLKKRYENPDQTIIVRKYEDLSDEELQAKINARIDKTAEN